MAIIRADTDQLRAVARQMRTTADQITGGHDGMRQSMDSLDATWSGHARDRGMARWGEIAPKYRPSADGLVHLANELEALAQRLDDAAAVFGAGGGGDGGKPDSNDQNWDDTSDVEDAPQNMAGLFDRLSKDNKGNEIQIYQVGPNEYAVLLQGTDPSDLTGMNSLEQAVENGLDVNTRYKEKLEELLKKLPDGANVHLLGYSLGGIVAQNVAADSQFFANNGLNLSSISTYGSPRPLNSIPSDKYYADFDAPFDIVSSAALRPTPELLMTTTLLGLAPVTTVLNGINMHLKGYQEEWSPTRQAMQKTPPPFDSKKWKLVDSYDEEAKEIAQHANGSAHMVSKAAVTQKLSDGTQAVVNTYNSATQTVGDAVQNTADVVNDSVNAIKDYGSSAVNNMKQFFSW